MDDGLNTAWVDFMAHAAAMQSMIDDFKETTNKVAPKAVTTLDIAAALAEPDSPLVDYLSWVTLAHWGTDGVPEDFVAVAKAKWPKLRTSLII